MAVTRTSTLSGKTRTLQIEVDPADVQRYEEGELIQKAFPYLSDDEREFIITGVTPDEWEATFGKEG